MDIILTVVITALISIAGTWITKDIVEASKPPHTQIINTTTEIKTTMQTIVDTKAIASTSIYNGLSNQEFIFAITNELTKSNSSVIYITNTNFSKTITN